MGAMQTKLMTEFKTIAQAAGLTADVEMNWANTGLIFFRDGFETKATLYFDFQSSYGTVALAEGANKPSEHFNKATRTFRFDYTDAVKIQDLLRTLERTLPKKKKKKKGPSEADIRKAFELLAAEMNTKAFAKLVCGDENAKVEITVNGKPFKGGAK